MGVVYKALDQRLHRVVALKLLPPEMVADPERRRRLIHEARTASALNHPNILTVYEIDSADGTDYIAMEYVDGRTLGDVLAPSRRGKRMPVNDVVTYATQIASALSKAHDAGIVHRDLKPANIMINRDGFVKILDFGLAKSFEPPGVGSSELTKTRLPQTQFGAIVGTAAYMSPEQAEGRSVDARFDLFSFGAVVYEMITGRQAFGRESVIATLSAILNDEPPALRAVAPDVPLALQQIVSRCLQKNPRRRFQHAADLHVALDEIREQSTAGTRAVVPALSPQRHTAWLGVAAIVSAAAVAGIVAWYRSAPLPPAALSGSPVPLTTEAGEEDFATFSPDGNQVAYSWNGEQGDNFDIYVKQVGLPNRLRLTSSPASDLHPSWSPDGRSLAFLRELSDGRAALMLIPVLGGAERQLAECSLPKFPFTNPSPAWPPDGQWLIVADRQTTVDPLALTAVSVRTGEKRTLTSPPPKTIGDSDAAVSPDGSWLAFVRGPSFLVGNLSVLSLSPDLTPKGEPRTLTSDNRTTARPAWLPDSRNLVFSAGFPGGMTLWRTQVSGSAEPQRLAFGYQQYSPTIAANGQRLAFTQGLFDPNIWQMPLDDAAHAGRPSAWLVSTRIEGDPAFSPDGKRSARQRSDAGR